MSSSLNFKAISQMARTCPPISSAADRMKLCGKAAKNPATDSSSMRRIVLAKAIESLGMVRVSERLTMDQAQFTIEKDSCQ
jgi:hypothetical protein